ncbi:MAG TPA: hypothetical protein VG798_02035 [Rhizomicrobium sp.]|nr:hypothetical protein [Rhizomicrobium sp.]
MALTRSEARKIALSLPGTSEGSHYGKPSIFLGERFFCRVHDREEAVVLLTGSIEMRDVMLEAEPALFYITEHYRNYPAILARLEILDRKTLKDLLTASSLRLEQKKAAKKRPAAEKTAKKKKGR